MDETLNKLRAAAAADETKVWALADYCIPADVREMAERWKMPEALIELWRGAFIEGWRSSRCNNS